MPKKEILYPLDKNGELLSYDDGFYTKDRVVNRVWDDTMTYKSYYRGRSAAGIELCGLNGKTWPMFMSDMDTVIRTKTIINGKFSGTFTMVKKGANFGVKLVQ